MIRTWLDATGLRTSIVGVNAQTATLPYQFIFDSRNRAYFGAFLSGFVAYSAFNGSGAYTLMFGHTFAAPPAVLLAWDSPLYSGFSPTCFSVISGAPSSAYTMSATVMTDSIVFYAGTSASSYYKNVYYLIGHS